MLSSNPGTEPWYNLPDGVSPGAGADLRDPLNTCAKWAFRLLAGLGMLVVLVTATPFVTWYATRLAGPWSDPQGDILIVPCAEAVDSELMGQGSFLRTVYALLAYRRGGFRQIVLSGAGTSVRMRDFLIFAGVPAGCIRLEESSTSTRENALRTRELLVGAPGRKVLLTSDYHMWRAWRAFRKAGLDVAPRPIPDARKRAVRWSNRWQVFVDEMVETAKIGYYFARGWI